jgi:hypothetical protein
MNIALCNPAKLLAKDMTAEQIQPQPDLEAIKNAVRQEIEAADIGKQVKAQVAAQAAEPKNPPG